MAGFVVLDFETTGLDPQEEQVIEIGAVKLDDNLNEVGSFNVYVQLEGGRVLREFIKNYTGITEKELEYGMGRHAAMRSLKDFIGHSTVVAQFASFDLSFLHPWKVPYRFICTRSMSQLLGYQKNGLKDLVARYGVELVNHHRAVDDARATVEVFKIMKEELDAKGIEYDNIMTERADRKLNYKSPFAKVITL